MYIYTTMYIYAYVCIWGVCVSYLGLRIRHPLILSILFSCGLAVLITTYCK